MPLSAADPWQTRLVTALTNPDRYGHPVERVDVVETHISYVFLTGVYAYKIKKPLNLGFLDFSTLEARRRYCEEELRLNRRLAPELYLAVVAITGSPDDPVFDGDGPVIEYAVMMREFPQDALLDRVLARGELTQQLVDAIAARIAAFHGEIERADADSPLGTPEYVLQPALQNFDQIRPLLDDAADLSKLQGLQAWTEREFKEKKKTFTLRKQGGFVRECHGDLHLGNIALFNGEITAFDCIEFNERLRWIDVLNEAAFLFMDLYHRNRPDYAYRFLNAYLEITGDYAGLRVLRYYLVYRAMVRAKVTRIRASQAGLSTQAKTGLLDEYRGYIELAEHFARGTRAAVIINHGLSGSGKTTLSQTAMETLGAIRIRSDVERKRMHGVAISAPSQSAMESGLYSPEATLLTYHRLEALARTAVAADFPVIVDATFLKHSQRHPFRELAVEMNVPFVIVDYVASERILRERIAQRQKEGRDASEATLEVLERQLATQEPLQPDELPYVIHFDAQMELAPGMLAQAWRPLRERLSMH